MGIAGNGKPIRLAAGFGLLLNCFLESTAAEQAASTALAASATEAVESTPDALVASATELEIATDAQSASAAAGADVIPDVNEAPVGGDFSLNSAAGQLSLSDLRGSAVLLAFGFTHCPDVCPTTLSFLSSALNALDQGSLARTRGLFITLDPERDTVVRLHEYARYFHDSIHGLSGTADEIEQVAHQYGVQYATVKLEGSSVEYTINHSAAIYLVNPQGELQFVFPHMTPPAVMAEAVEHVLSISNE